MTTATETFSLRAVYLALVLGLFAQATALWDLFRPTERLTPTLVDLQAVVVIVAVLSILTTLWAGVTLWRQDAARQLVGGGHVRLFLMLGLGGGVLQIFCVETFHVVWVQLFIGTAIAIGAACTLWTAAIKQALPPLLIRSTDVVILSCAILVVGGEVTLRLLSVVKPSPMFIRASDPPEKLLAAHRYRPKLMRWGFPTNERGHYDDRFLEIADKKNILVIGDSFSTGIVPHPDHYTTVAERTFTGANLWNLGQPKTGPAGYQLLLQTEGLVLQPDAIVVSIFVGNDLTESRNIGKDIGTYESWFAPENILLIQVPNRIALVISEQSRLQGRSPGGNQDETKASQRIDDPAELAKQFPWTQDPMLEQGSFSAVQFARIEAERARNNHFAARRDLYNKLFTALLEMRAMAADIPFLVMLIPDEYQIDTEIWNRVRADNADLELERDRPQQEILSRCRQQSIPCLDLLPVLRATDKLTDGKPHLYHRQNTHLNTRGNRATGEALGAFLRQHLAK